MTLDEARETLGVVRGASITEIRDAFRRRARDVHPDRHPAETADRRRQLARATDAAGFGPGGRTRRWIDWPRIIVWSALGAITAAVVVGIAVMAVLL